MRRGDDFERSVSPDENGAEIESEGRFRRFDRRLVDRRLVSGSHETRRRMVEISKMANDQSGFKRNLSSGSEIVASINSVSIRVQRMNER